MTNTNQPFKVKWSPQAEQYYKLLKEAAHTPDGVEKQGSKEVVAYRGVRDTIENIIAFHGADMAYALGKKREKNFAGIFRCRTGRLRTCWIASRDKQTVIVLFIGFRAKGDKKRDVYEKLHRFLKNGDFDIHFDELGIENPAYR